MNEEILKIIKEYSKDEDAFSELKKLYKEIDQQKQQYQEQLGLLESAIRNDYDAILITELALDKPGPRIVYVNEAFAEITGYLREEVIGQTPRILQGEKTDRKTLDRLKEKLENGKSFFGRLINYRKDGSEFVNQFDIHPLKDKSGEITHWVSYIHDITERKRAERNVVDTEIEFDKLKQESKRTLVDADEQGNIIMANRSFRDLVGYDQEELQKMKVWDLLTDKFRTSLQGRFEKEMKNQDFEQQSFRVLIKHKSGAPLQVEIATRVLALKDRRIIRGDVKNITFQKRVLRNLEEHKKEFSRLFRNVTDFTYRLGKDEEGNYHFETLSENFPELTGYYGDEFIKHGKWEKLIHPEDLEKARNHLRVAFKGDSHTEEYRMARSDGSYLRILDYVQPVKDEGENTAITAVRGAVTTHLSKIRPTE